MAEIKRAKHKAADAEPAAAGSGDDYAGGVVATGEGAAGEELQMPASDGTVNGDAAPGGDPCEGETATPETLFSIERLRRDCLKLFGVSESAFDGAMRATLACGVREISLSGAKAILDGWLNTRIGKGRAGAKAKEGWA